MTKKIINPKNRTVKMQNTGDEWYELTIKALWGLFYIVVGFIGKIANLIQNGKKKMSWLEFFASFGIALFVGYLSYVICEYRGWEQKIKWIVPLATYMSDKLSIVILRMNKVNWKTLMIDWLDSFKKNTNE